MFNRIALSLCAVPFLCFLAHAEQSSGYVLTGGAKVAVTARYSGPTLPKPEQVILQDFIVSDQSVTTDDSIAGRLRRRRLLRDGTDQDSSPQVLTAQVQAAFRKGLVSELEKADVQIANVGDEIGLEKSVKAKQSLVISGQFTAIDEGDKSHRVMVGLGRGASNVRIHVMISSVTNGHSIIALEFDATSASGKKPGALETMGVGSLAVGAAAGGVGDRNSTVEADTARLSKAVALQVEQLMASQKWIACGSGVNDTKPQESK